MILHTNDNQQPLMHDITSSVSDMWLATGQGPVLSPDPLVTNGILLEASRVRMSW